jgi:hypothetical protein
MKKILLFASLFANFVFLLLACQKDSATVSNRGNVTIEAAGSSSATSVVTTAAVVPTPVIGTCTGPVPIMPYDLVRNMIQNYCNNQQQAIANALQMEDANASWFELLVIKNFICHLEDLVAQSGCTNINNLGLRFYYAAHTTNPASYGLPTDYARLHNLIIVPTYQAADGTHVDFDPRTIGQGACGPPLLDLKSGGGTPPVGTTITDIFALNHAQLGPPGPIR